MKYLAKQGADLTQASNARGTTTHGYLPIHWATENGYDSVVRCLISHGAKINMRLGSGKYHLIHIAAQKGHLKIVKMLLDENPDLLDVTDADNQTPILWAAAEGHAHVVDYLATLGADLTIATQNGSKTYQGYLPIHWATGKGHHAVVKQLIDHGAEINIRFGEMQYHLIHIAAQKGQLEIVKMLLDKNPALLELMDAYNQTPMLLAAANGHAHVVKYLISKKANLNCTTHRPNHKDHGKTPLTRAMEGGHHEVTNLLQLELKPNQSGERVIPFIQTGKQALELMIQEPSLITMLMQDERVEKLIHSTDSVITKQSIDWYKPAGRRLSWFASINLETNTSSVYKPVKELGKGTYGLVRLFQNATGEAIGVKSPRSNLVDAPDSERDVLSQDLKREAEFNKRAYPEDISKFFEFDYQWDDEDIYTNRFIMPYVKGEILHLFLPKIPCHNQLAEIILQIAQELQRIHDTGIIHGDIKEDNIIIRLEDNKCIVRFIDFGCSSYITENRAITFNTKNSYIAPERLCNESTRLKPNANQDIYSFGLMLNRLLEKNSAYLQLIQKYPCIERFLSAAKNTNPQERPSLQAFCKQLNTELNPQNETDTLNTNTTQMKKGIKRAPSTLTIHNLWTQQKKGARASAAHSTKNQPPPATIEEEGTKRARRT